MRLQFLIAALHDVADLHIVNARIDRRLSSGAVGGPVGAGEGLDHLSASRGNVRHQGLGRTIVGVDGRLNRSGVSALAVGADHSGRNRAFVVVLVAGILGLDGVIGVRGQALKDGALLPVCTAVNGEYRARDGGNRNAVSADIAGHGRGGGVLLHLGNGQGGSDRLQRGGPRLHGEADGYGISPGVGGGNSGVLAVHGIGHGGFCDIGDRGDLIGNGIASVRIGLRLHNRAQITGIHRGELRTELCGDSGRHIVVAVLSGFQTLVEGVACAGVQIFEHRAVLPHLPVHAVLGVIHSVQRQGIGGGTGQRGGGTGLRRLLDHILDRSGGELGIALLHDKGDGGGVIAGIHGGGGTAVRPAVVRRSFVRRRDGLDALRQSGHGQSGRLPIINLGVIFDGRRLHCAIGQVDRGSDSGKVVIGELGEVRQVQGPLDSLRQRIGVITGAAPGDGDAGDCLCVASAAIGGDGNGGGQAQRIEPGPHGSGPHHFLNTEDGPGNYSYGDGHTAQGDAALGYRNPDFCGPGLAGIKTGIAGVNGPGIKRGIDAVACGQLHRLDGITHIDAVGSGENPGQGIDGIEFPILGLPDVVGVGDGCSNGVRAGGHRLGNGGRGIHRQLPVLHLYLAGGQISGDALAVDIQIGDGFAVQKAVAVINLAVKGGIPGNGFGQNPQPLRRLQLYIVINSAVHSDNDVVGAGSGDGDMVVQRGAHIAVERRDHVIDHRIGVAAVLHAIGHGFLIGGVQLEGIQRQHRDVDLRPAAAAIAGVFDVAVGGSRCLDNIRLQRGPGDTVVGCGNAAILLIGVIHHEIDRLLIRGRVVGIRRGPCGRIVVLGGCKRLGGQQGHAQAECQHQAQSTGKVSCFVHRQKFLLSYKWPHSRRCTAAESGADILFDTIAL